VGEEIGYKVENPDERRSSPLSTVRSRMGAAGSRVYTGGSRMM